MPHGTTSTMNFLHDIPHGDTKKLNAIIEIPKFSRIKYEVDKATGLIKFDRVLYSPMHYPANYGFVPQTWWADEDPLDMLVLGEEPIAPGVLVVVRPIGALEMNDGGDDDLKMLGVPTEDPRFATIHDISDITPHLLKEIAHFFSRYKELQKKEVKVGDWLGKDAAFSAVEKAVALYKKKFSK